MTNETGTDYDWQEIESYLDQLGATNYADLDPKETKRKARREIREAFIGLERLAGERHVLREMLLELGVENAHLMVEIEQLKVQLKTARQR
jgi:hypothetical protein